ncbi:hypothetical protein J2X46_001046 [Nocardioides sp. BE266]|uniref:hypothetical protein n=1 Tax=Nocardioides sp. BE266 TaxID=2817725 RepID=UPI002864E28F|nr:hypothetical protein [Nocardioides sp. BE266]MDR7252070.1 hypothetical protein [Nocardioides sp. BE266]
MKTLSLRTVSHTVAGALAAALIAGLPAPSAQAERVRPELFGMDLIQSTAPPAPLESTPTMRLIINWAKVEKEPGSYDWSTVDAMIEMARKHDSRPLLTLYGTPSFWATRPSAIAAYVRPPRLSAYRAFVRALALRYGSRADYQLWAEMNVPGNYFGPVRHMAKMARVASQEVHTNAPGAQVVAPQGPIRYKENRDWFRDFWSQRVHGKRVAKWVDVASLSGFPLPKHGPEKGIRLVKWLRRITSEQGFSGPIWIVEINYDVNGPNPTVPISTDQQVANVVKTYVLNASIGTQRVYWHYWSRPKDNMNTAMLTDDGQLAPPGKAFGVIQPWLIGTRAEECTITKNGDLYSCLFTRKRVERRVIWTVSGRKRMVAVPERTKRVYSPDGTVRSLGSQKRVRAGVVPVMIESRRASGSKDDSGD